MASGTPIYEQFAIQRKSIRSIQPVQQSPTQQNKHSISLISSTPVDVSPYPQAHAHEQNQGRQAGYRQRPQSQYYEQPQQASKVTTDLKHSRSQSHALFPLKRKEVPENAGPQRSKSVIMQQNIRVSNGSYDSEHSGLSNVSESRSNYSNETAATAYTAPSSKQAKKSSGYSHHAAVQGATGYAPQEPAQLMPAFSKKFVVVGDGGSGKTCLLMRYKERTFPDKYVPTVFENYITLKHHRGSGKTCEVALWDTAGQEEYDRLRPLSYPETDIILVVFAIDCPQSLDSVKEKWFPEVTHFCPTTPLILVGCKSDLRENANCLDQLEGQGLRPLTMDEGRDMARYMGAEAYIECSSKDMINVDEVFELAIDIAVAGQVGTPWHHGRVGKMLQHGSLGAASMISRPVGHLANGGGGQVAPGVVPSKSGKGGKKKKSRACRIL